MSKSDIIKFYEAAVKQKKFNLNFWKELKEISTQEELKSFIEKKVQPISKKMGYNFSTKELLDYEKQMAKKITEKQLEAVSGGVNVKNLALGGIVSLMALGAGVIASTSSTSAQLNIEAIEGSEEIASGVLDKEIPISKKEAAKLEEEGRTSEKAAEVRVSAEEKKEEVKPQKETRGRSSVLDKEEEKEVSSDTESSDTEDLELTKAATEVDPAKITETRQLTDEQKLYVYEALNLQEAYALLHSGVIENIRIFGNIVEIETVNGVRRYTADKGDDFIELLYMLFPSSDGTLNTSTTFKGRDSFAIYGGISSELMAKFCAFLNDYRNGKAGDFPEKFESFCKKQKVGVNEINVIDDNFLKAVKWLEGRGILPNEPGERLSDELKKIKEKEAEIEEIEKTLKEIEEYFDKINRAEKKLNRESKKLDSSVAKPPEGAEIPKTVEGETTTITLKRLDGTEITKTVDGETTTITLKLSNGTEIAKTVEGETTTITLKLSNGTEIIKTIKGKKTEVKLVEGEIEFSLTDANNEIQAYNNSVRAVRNDVRYKKVKLYISFINALKDAVKLENVYPKYLTEHVLMAYMIKTLNKKEDVKELYQKIARELSQNESSKETTKEDKKAKIAEEIAKAKARMTNLNEILKAAEVQELSPYKGQTLSNASALQIGGMDAEGNVQIKTGTFADCADITLRHLLNLLGYAKDQNWDWVLPKNKEEIDRLKVQLKAVIDAINNNGKEDKDKVKFYNLKDRIQMFFLYQSGFVEGRDSEDDGKYRSPNGADDVTILARTLWEYVICNMDKENLRKGPDKDSGLYPIVYSKSKNHELKPGYINQLKLMWNIAHALGLGTETANGETKLGLAKESIEDLKTNLAEQAPSTMEKAKADFLGKFGSTLSSVFSLFYQGAGLKVQPTENCIYEKIDGNDEVIGIVEVEVTKDEQKLSFSINQMSGHALVDHNPVSFDEIKYAEKDEEKQEKLKVIRDKSIKGIKLTKDEKKLEHEFSEKVDKKLNSIKADFEGLLVVSFLGLPLINFYRYLSEKNFRRAEILKRFSALSAFKALQNEEANVERIGLITSEAMVGANEINVEQIKKDKDGKTEKSKKTLAEIFYENYLRPNVGKFSTEYLREVVYPSLKGVFGGIEKIYSTEDHTPESEITNFEVIKTSKEGNEVILLIKSIPDDGNLNIPATIYDENGKPYEVAIIGEKECIGKGRLNTVSFVGNFGGLSIASWTFKLCRTLQTVNFTGTVKSLSIGREAFGFCEALSTITISEAVESLTIGNKAFSRCLSLTTFEIPEGVTTLSIEEDAFSNCWNLTTFKISKGVKSLLIGESAFAECGSLTTITIPESVTYLSIGEGAFARCEALTTFTIPKGITSLSIRGAAFEDCKALATITIPEGVTFLSIGEVAFKGCEALTTFEIPEGVTYLSIEKEAFNDCLALTTFEIPEGVTSLSIGEEAFKVCNALTTFTISEGVTSLVIGNQAFEGCRALETIIIPENVTSLAMGDRTFYWCMKLKPIIIPEGVTTLSIGEEAFEGCYTLATFPIPKSVTSLSIGNLAFKSCDKLKSITIPDSVESIELGSNMLYLSSVEKLLMPKHLEGKIPEDFDGKDKIEFYDRSTQPQRAGL